MKNSLVHKKFENSKVKITVEQNQDFKYIATFWNKESCYEVDRLVIETETYGGALDVAFDTLVQCIEEGCA